MVEWKTAKNFMRSEALIENKYNVDEIQQRILNGDGGIDEEPYDSRQSFN